MLHFGLISADQYQRASKKRRMSAVGVSLNLLEVGDPASAEEISRFEEITYSMRTSNGSTRTTFRHRLDDVDQTATRLMLQFYPPDEELIIQDRGASNCLTSSEWAAQVLPIFRKARLEASDAVLYLYRVSLVQGGTYFVEPNGIPVQFLYPPFVVCLTPREPYRYLVNQAIGMFAKRAFHRRFPFPFEQVLNSYSESAGYRVDKISCVHPEARRCRHKEPRFHISERSVFESVPGLHILRTMNILNLAYFPTHQLRKGIRAAFESVRPGGLWIVGRTTLEDSKNHVTFFRRNERNWDVLERIGQGSEIESLVMTATTKE